MGVETEFCEFCGHELDEEDLKLFAKHGPLECIDCHRLGCNECMPGGRNCLCPECEEKQ